MERAKRYIFDEIVVFEKLRRGVSVFSETGFGKVEILGGKIFDTPAF